MSETPPSRPTVPFQIRIASALCNAVGAAAKRRDGTVNRRLLSFLDFKAPPNPDTVDGVSTSDHTVDPTRNLKVRLFTPSPTSDGAVSSSPLPVIVYFHGGGFFSNSAFSRPFDALCRRFSRRIPALVVSVDYRLSPEHRFPAPYDDGLDVLRWLDTGDLIADLSAVFVSGDSAGGNIAHHVARRAMLTSSFNRLSLVGLFLIQPFFGGEEDTESERNLEGVPFGSREGFKWAWRAFLPAESDLDHEAANVFGPGSGSGSGSEDWAGFPATEVVIGGMDTLQDRQRRYCKGLKGVGVDVGVVEYPAAPHGFQCLVDLPESGQLLDDLAGFVRRRSEHCRSERASEEF